MVEQLEGPLPGLAAGRAGRIVAAEQLHKRCAELFGRPPWPLGLERMPVALTDAQPLMQGDRKVAGPFGPLVPGAVGLLKHGRYRRQRVATCGREGQGPSWRQIGADG